MSGYSSVLVFTGTASAVQFPKLSANRVMFQVPLQNGIELNSAWMGIGTSQDTCDFALYSGDNSGWVECYDLSQFWYKSLDDASGTIVVWVNY